MTVDFYIYSCFFVFFGGVTVVVFFSSFYVYSLLFCMASGKVKEKRKNARMFEDLFVLFCSF